jgi:hypothetical protein
MKIGGMKIGKQEKAKQQLVWLPPALIEKVHQAAKENYRSLSGEIAYILEQYFKHQANEPPQTEDNKQGK